MEITITELRAISEKLLNYLEQFHPEKVRIDASTYWAVPHSEKFDPYRTPNDATLGVLDDDLNELRRIVAGESEPFTYGFVWFAAILDAIGTRVSL